jgi:hypothetical protein
MAFTQKEIQLTLRLGTGQFGDTGYNTVTLNGLRIKAEIQDYGGSAMPQIQLLVYGLPPSMMNQLTTIGKIFTSIRAQNQVIVAVGDSGSALTTVYSGNINEAWADYNQIPDAALNIIGLAGAAAALKPVGASSYPGQADVGTIMQSMASMADLSFINHGVSVQLSNPYFPGTALAQIRECAQAAGINFTIDNGALEIWPKSGSRSLSSIPVISTQTGMVGYPTFSSNGLMLTTLFNPSIKVGAQIQVQSSIRVPDGAYVVQQVSHSLESITPDGQWFTYILATPPDETTPNA